jgi:glutathione S-transferase
MSSNGNMPVLWHLKVSNYNEKARWALDFKGVPHVRRAAIPGRHEKVARRLSGGNTFPVLEIDGRAIGDSTEIVAELERRVPDPSLYPSDPEERRRALELEDFFDEELGPPTRLLVVNHLLVDGGPMLDAFAPGEGRLWSLIAHAAFPLMRPKVAARFGIDEQAVERAYEQVRAAGRRFRSELRPSGYLVGDRFTVADLTAAALVAPAVAPVQFPYPQPQRDHPLLADLRAALSESGLLQWTYQMYERHRGRSVDIAA